jgi:hypothetical protein
MNLNRLFVVVAFCLGEIASGRCQDPNLAIKFGMTPDQVQAIDGKPTRFIDTKTQISFTSPPPAPVGPLVECHTRKTETQEYELRISYKADASRSRLHPALRVDSFLVLVDKPQNYQVTIRSSNEIQGLCKSGCALEIVRLRPLFKTNLRGKDADENSDLYLPHLRIWDAAKTTMVELENFDEAGNQHQVMTPADQVTNLYFHAFSNAIDSRMEIAHAIDFTTR